MDGYSKLILIPSTEWMVILRSAHACESFKREAESFPKACRLEEVKKLRYLANIALQMEEVRKCYLDDWIQIRGGPHWRHTEVDGSILQPFFHFFFFKRPIACICLTIHCEITRFRRYLTGNGLDSVLSRTVHIPFSVRLPLFPMLSKYNFHE